MILVIVPGCTSGWSPQENALILGLNGLSAPSQPCLRWIDTTAHKNTVVWCFARSSMGISAWCGISRRIYGVTCNTQVLACAAPQTQLKSKKAW
jgi:hypothetical protein